MDTPVDTCEVLYEIPVDGQPTLIDALADEMDIYYEQEDTNVSA